MPPTRRLPPEDLSADAISLIKTLGEGSDFTVVVVGLSYLDACLSSLLSRHFLQGSTADELLDPTRGPLGSLAAKAKLAYALGLIYKPFLQDILTLAELRNIVAHSHLELDFEAGSVRSLCQRLALVTQIRRIGSEELLVTSEQYTKPRDRFILSCVVIWGHILAKAHDTTHVAARA
jgi:Mannitol repressor